MTFQYDRDVDILYINTCEPYPEQESEELFQLPISARLQLSKTYTALQSTETDNSCVPLPKTTPLSGATSE